MTKKEIANEAEALEAVKINGMLLRNVSDALKTYEVCLEAVKNFCIAVQFVPEELRTLELYKEVIKSEGTAIAYVPDKLKTPELCLMSVQNYYVPEFALHQLNCYVSKHFSKDIIEQVKAAFEKGEAEAAEIVEKYGSLDKIPENLRNVRVCLAAVKRNGLMLAHVPMDLRKIGMGRCGAGICEAALQENIAAFEFIPDNYKSLGLCLGAMEKDSSMFKFVPERLKEEVKAELEKKVGQA